MVKRPWEMQAVTEENGLQPAMHIGQRMRQEARATNMTYYQRSSAKAQLYRYKGDKWRWETREARQLANLDAKMNISGATDE